MITEDQKIIAKKYLDPRQGMMSTNLYDYQGGFGLCKSDGSCSTFHSCRESFLSSYNKNKVKSFLFHRSGTSTELIRKFFKIIENKLKLKNKSYFCKTYKKNVYLVFPSNFWLENVMKRGLFTILLRSSGFHEKDAQVWDTLKKYKYSQKTLPAIQRFLEGYTKAACRGSYYSNWYNKFRYCECWKEKDLEKKLVKPE